MVLLRWLWAAVVLIGLTAVCFVAAPITAYFWMEALNDEGDNDEDTDE